MLEQNMTSITSRRYIRNAENQIEIHDYEYSDNGEIKYEISEYNNYDPRKRPWYVAAKKAGGRHGLTVLFLGHRCSKHNSWKNMRYTNLFKW